MPKRKNAFNPVFKGGLILREGREGEERDGEGKGKEGVGGEGGREGKG